MYHDQVLTPIKTIYEFNAINITLGLPFIRITPDHGPNNFMIGKNKSIKVRFYEDRIKSNKTFDLINYLTKKQKYDIYFIMGADNLINFHKWYKWKSILQKCNILVFDRHGLSLIHI